jgi:hypothetical protein
MFPAGFAPLTSFFSLRHGRTTIDVARCGEMWWGVRYKCCQSQQLLQLPMEKLLLGTMKCCEQKHRWRMIRIDQNTICSSWYISIHFICITCSMCVWMRIQIHFFFVGVVCNFLEAKRAGFQTRFVLLCCSFPSTRHHNNGFQWHQASSRIAQQVPLLILLLYCWFIAQFLEQFARSLTRSIAKSRCFTEACAWGHGGRLGMAP